MKKVYISGPMTGLPDNNYPAFDARAKELWAAGYMPCNPADLGRDLANRHSRLHRRQPTWTEHIVEDLLHLTTCEAITFLTGDLSPGMAIEQIAAERLGLEVV
jgi:hypothetical protein